MFRVVRISEFNGPIERHCHHTYREAWQEEQIQPPTAENHEIAVDMKTF